MDLLSFGVALQMDKDKRPLDNRDRLIMLKKACSPYTIDLRVNGSDRVQLNLKVNSEDPISTLKSLIKALRPHLGVHLTLSKGPHILEDGKSLEYYGFEPTEEIYVTGRTDLSSFELMKDISLHSALDAWGKWEVGELRDRAGKQGAA